MAFTAMDVKTLREKTGCGMMDCKKALTESGGDMDKAVDILREKGLAVANKKSSRIAAEGLVECYVDGNVGVVVEINSETDFVAKNEEFKSFVLNVAKTVAKNNPKDVDELKTMKLFGSDMTVDEALKDKIFTIGENMNIRRFERQEGTVATYVHGGGRIGVMVVLDAPSNDATIEVGKDLCMQIAAMNPQYISKDTVPADVIAKEKEILLVQIKNDDKNKNKPDNIIEKMVLGRLGKFYEDACLLSQAFIKDPDVTIEKYINDKAKDLGINIGVKSFCRFEKGEGLEKREDNFADEVSKMIK